MLFLLLFAHLIVSLQSHCLDRLHLGSTKKKVFFLCTSLGLHYLWTYSPKILTFGKAEEKMLFLLLFAHLIVSLQSHCLDRLHLGSTKKKVFFLCTSLGLHYLWTYSPKILTFGKAEEKMLFLLLFAHLIVSLQSHCLDRLHLGSTKKKVFFLCTSLGLHYLCTENG